MNLCLKLKFPPLCHPERSEGPSYELPQKLNITTPLSSLAPRDTYRSISPQLLISPSSLSSRAQRGTLLTSAPIFYYHSRSVIPSAARDLSNLCTYILLSPPTCHPSPREGPTFELMPQIKISPALSSRAQRGTFLPSTPKI